MFLALGPRKFLECGAKYQKCVDIPVLSGFLHLALYITKVWQCQQNKLEINIAHFKIAMSRCAYNC